jgi:hypothetical protein
MLPSVAGLGTRVMRGLLKAMCKLARKSNALAVLLSVAAESVLYHDISLALYQPTSDWGTTCATCNCSRHPLRRDELSRRSRAVVRLEGARAMLDEAVFESGASVRRTPFFNGRVHSCAGYDFGIFA